MNEKLKIKSHRPNSLAIVVGRECDTLERFAAGELRKYLSQLFKIAVPLYDDADERLHGFSDSLILLGTPTTNRITARIAGDLPWSDLSDQGYVVQTFLRGSTRIIVAGGGSPTATLWAVYELLEGYDIRFQIDGDVLPDDPGPWRLLDLNIKREPAIRWRVLTGHNLHIEGPASWGFEEYRKFLDQAAKMKFNGYFFMIREIGPWYELEFRDCRSTKADIYGGGWREPRPITSELIGWENVVDEGAFFYSPAFVHCRTDAERFEAGRLLVKQIFEHARQRGIKVGLHIDMATLPPEFRSKFPQWSEIARSDVYNKMHPATAEISARENVTDPLLWEITQARYRKIVETYPDLDWYRFAQIEWQAPTARSRDLWSALNAKYAIDELVNLEECLTHGDLYPVRRDNFEEVLLGNVDYLYLFDKLFVELDSAKFFPATAHLASCDWLPFQEFYPLLKKLWPPQFGLHFGLDYNFHRALRYMNCIESLRNDPREKWMVASIDEDNNMWIAQHSVRAIHACLQACVEYGVEGIEAAHWRVRDIAPSTRYFAEACWNAHLTPDQFYDDYFNMLYGAGSVAPLTEAFTALEDADRFGAQELIGIAFSAPGRLHFLQEVGPAGLAKHAKLRGLYQRALDLLKNAEIAVKPTSRPRLNFWIIRVRFSVAFLDILLNANAIDTALKENTEQPDGKLAAILPKMDHLVQEIHKAITDFAQDIKDRGDKGMLMNLNHLLYREAQDWRERVLKAAPDS